MVGTRAQEGPTPGEQQVEQRYGTVRRQEQSTLGTRAEPPVGNDDQRQNKSSRKRYRVAVETEGGDNPASEQDSGQVLLVLGRPAETEHITSPMIQIEKSGGQDAETGQASEAAEASDVQEQRDLSRLTMTLPSLEHIMTMDKRQAAEACLVINQRRQAELREVQRAVETLMAVNRHRRAAIADGEADWQQVRPEAAVVGMAEAWYASRLDAKGAATAGEEPPESPPLGSSHEELSRPEELEERLHHRRYVVWDRRDMQRLEQVMQQYLEIHPEAAAGADPEWSLVDWNKVAQRYAQLKASKHTAPRSAFDLRVQWTNVQAPTVNRKPLTKAQETRLIQLVAKYEMHRWEDIARELGSGHRPIQLLMHWQASLGQPAASSSWTPEESQRLIEAVAICGPRNWKRVARLMGNRTVTQCTRHYLYACNPQHLKGPWRTDEDRRLILAVRACMSPDLTTKDWNSVSELVGTRSMPSCRDHWVSQVDPAIVHRGWSQEERLRLELAVQQYGVGNWAKMESQLPGRSHTQIRNTYLAMHPETRQLTAKRMKLGQPLLGRKRNKPTITLDEIVSLAEDSSEEGDDPVELDES